MIGNVMIDARSTGKYYHCKFIWPLAKLNIFDTNYNFISSVNLHIQLYVSWAVLLLILHLNALCKPIQTLPLLVKR